ncbi:chromosome segregation ATPase [Streptomyces sp. NRRL F-5630]|uniref:chromosome segregation ATPase n=1 Tax=Streptomyces sp. NRRL F-5630 TaxID=1463864 RepID=UPI003EB6A5FF
MAGTPRQKAAQSEDRPKWVPLREDQHAELNSLARELMLARSRKSERITENTVIRVAVDLLLRHPEFLGGDTEDELRTTALRRVEELLERERHLLAGRTADDEDPGEGQ